MILTREKIDIKKLLISVVAFSYEVDIASIDMMTNVNHNDIIFCFFSTHENSSASTATLSSSRTMVSS